MSENQQTKSNLSNVFLFALLGVGLIYLFAQITFDVPFGETSIPITGQSFMVLLFAFSFKNRYIGLTAAILYLLLGLVFPIYANGSSGIESLTGNSGGYLLGFIPAAYVVGMFAQKDWDKSFIKGLLAMAIGTAIILACGAIYFAITNSSENLLANTVTPFLSGGAIKIIAAAAFWPFYYWLHNFHARKQ